MRPFLLVWNSAQVDVYQQQLLAHLDSRPEIKNYYAPFLGTILIIADQNQSPSSLSNLIHMRFPSLLIAVSPADQWSIDGWMPQVFWNLIQSPRSSGKWDPAPPGLQALADLLKVPPKK